MMVPSDDGMGVNTKPMVEAQCVPSCSCTLPQALTALSS